MWERWKAEKPSRHFVDKIAEEFDVPKVFVISTDQTLLGSCLLGYDVFFAALFPAWFLGYFLYSFLTGKLRAGSIKGRWGMWRSLGAVPLGGAHRRVGGGGGVGVEGREGGGGGGIGGRGLPDSVASGGCRCVEGAAMLLCLNYPVKSTTIEINPRILLSLVWTGSEISSRWKSSWEHFGGWQESGRAPVSVWVLHPLEPSTRADKRISCVSATEQQDICFFQLQFYLSPRRSWTLFISQGGKLFQQKKAEISGGVGICFSEEEQCPLWLGGEIYIAAATKLVFQCRQICLSNKTALGIFFGSLACKTSYGWRNNVLGIFSPLIVSHISLTGQYTDHLVFASITALWCDPS